MWRKTETNAGDERRKRGWGPFSGGQLTIIIVTLAVLMLFPVGAWALSFTNVAIIDPGGVNRAKVNASGQLSVAATGSVTATPTPPNSSYTHVVQATQGSCRPITQSVPAGKALVVTSVTVAISAGTDQPVGVIAVSADGASPNPCTALNPANEIYASGLHASTVMSFPSGFPIKTGHILGVLMFSDVADHTADITVNGYFVSAAQCTVNGPPAGCN